MELNLGVILGAIIVEGVLMLLAFIGSTLYIKGYTMTKLESHDKAIAHLQDETVLEKTCRARMGLES